MSAIRKDTESLRVTLSQEIRYVVGQELDAPDMQRKVTLVFPPSPTIVLAVLPYVVRIGHNVAVATSLADFSAASAQTDMAVRSPQDFGLNRHYKLPEWTGTPPVRFRLNATQSIVAASTDGLAEMTIIVEYLKPKQH